MTLVRNSVLAYRIRNSVLSLSDICQILRHIDNQKSTERRSRPRLLAQTPGTRARTPLSRPPGYVETYKYKLSAPPCVAGARTRGSLRAGFKRGVTSDAVCWGPRHRRRARRRAASATADEPATYSRVSHTDASYASWLLSPPVRILCAPLSVPHVSPPRHEDAARS